MNSEQTLMKGNTAALVLAVLEHTPRHGYGIAREIERLSDKTLKFKEGTLYPVLHQLEAEGFIQGQWQREEGGRERKVYTILPAGLTALDQSRKTWNTFASAVNRVLGGENHAGTRNAIPADRVPDPEPA
jgi:PadR family transcriptional regulator, regulatory protein PadR